MAQGQTKRLGGPDCQKRGEGAEGAVLHEGQVAEVAGLPKWQGTGQWGRRLERPGNAEMAGALRWHGPRPVRRLGGPDLPKGCG